MQIDIQTLAPADQYRLLSSTVVPRPIALITSYSQRTGHNAAPFSFFNVMGEAPPVLAIGLEDKRGSGDLKDTTINIKETGEFVVHLVDEGLAAAMNVCAIAFPPEVNEVEQAGLTLVPSAKVRPRRIAQAPVAFECRKIAMLEINPHRHITLGEVLCMHVREGLFDAEMRYIDPNKYHPIGRMFGRLYTQTRQHFEMEVPEYEAWLAGKAEG
ncbi:flavin reductase family protein [Achromobacter aloeverae]|uniref:flavin reductase family protein n=1 Tax=Achromobacter aloeverae TaxID=1750518 RepID=UPI0013011720|nr:flavin reductase family protein [Achromobacter aloeverae]